MTCKDHLQKAIKKVLDSRRTRHILRELILPQEKKNKWKSKPEKWFQIELAYALKSHTNGGDDDLVIEDSHKRDGRKDIDKQRVQTDLEFRPKYFLTNKNKSAEKPLRCSVELKISDNAVGLKDVFRDIEKLSKLKSAPWNFRACFFVWLVPTCCLNGKNSRWTRVRNSLLEKGFGDEVPLKKDSPVRCFMFYWEPSNNREDFNIENYRIFSREIQMCGAQ